MWKEFLDLTLPPSIAVAFLGPLLKMWLEKSIRGQEERQRAESATELESYRAELSRQLEQVKSDLQALRSREQVMFSALHSRRVDKIVSFALGLFELELLVNYLVNSNGADEKEEAEFRAKSKALHEEFKPLWLFLPRSLGLEMHCVLTGLDRDAYSSFYCRIPPGTRVEVVTEIHKRRDELKDRYKQTKTLYNGLEDKFRKMLAVEEDAEEKWE